MDALAYTVERPKVIWIMDADVREFLVHAAEHVKQI